MRFILSFLDQAEERMMPISIDSLPPCSVLAFRVVTLNVRHLVFIHHHTGCYRRLQARALSLVKMMG